MNTHKPWSQRESMYIYGILPFGVLLVMVGMYFSEIGWMQAVVAPKVNREFGLLETLQHLLLISIVLLAARIARHSTGRLECVVFTLVALGATVQFLEEIDYGLHYYEALTGIPASERAVIRNIHNRHTESGVEFVRLIKPLMDLGLLIFFVVLPLAAGRVSNARLRSFFPSRWSILLLVGIFLISRLAHYLDDGGHGLQGSLTQAIGEFRELGVYYLFMLYILQCPFCGKSQAEGSS